jgi:hypothetical protein
MMMEGDYDPVVQQIFEEPTPQGRKELAELLVPGEFESIVRGDGEEENPDSIDDIDLGGED